MALHGNLRPPFLRRIPAMVFALACLVPGTGNAAEDIAREAANLKSRYAAEVGKLAAWCQEKDLAGEARKTLELIEPQDPYTVRLPMLPREVGSLRAAMRDVVGSSDWQRRWLKLREDQAASLFALAQRAVRRAQPALAYRLVLDAIAANPDQEGARRVLGYVKHQNRWCTPYEVAMLRGGLVWHPRFGWLERNHVARYERGERLFSSTWIDAAGDAALHAEITSGWDVVTEHYRIRSNHSIEAAVALGAKLEDLNRIWRQIFLGYYSSEADIEALFSGRPTRNTAAPRMEIVYFRDKQQYHRALKPIMPEIGVSMGLYVAENRTAYFYADGEDSERTTYHEATHQLFHQSRQVGEDVGRKANCWLIEGIALYMETLRHDGDDFLLGGLDDVRMTAARYHLEKKDFYVPFDKLVRLSLQDMQTHPEIAKLYSQIAAMTSFLVHYEDGRYRDALVHCLSAVYGGDQDPELLARATGASYAELDRQYRAYMAIAPAGKRSGAGGPQ
jgi:hypothetical protein